MISTDNPSLPQSNSRTLVALLGESGHGKSTLINALLEEDNTITASSMRACTSVPTEVRFNISHKAYRRLDSRSTDLMEQIK
jgi:predicted kinase